MRLIKDADPGELQNALVKIDEALASSDGVTAGEALQSARNSIQTVLTNMDELQREKPWGPTKIVAPRAPTMEEVNRMRIADERKGR